MRAPALSVRASGNGTTTRVSVADLRARRCTTQRLGLRALLLLVFIIHRVCGDQRRSFVRERGQKLLICRIKRTTDLIDDLQHPDGLFGVARSTDGKDEHISRLEI